MTAARVSDAGGRRADARAVIERHGGAPGKPAVVYRFAGDQAVLAEYGPDELDLTLNFLVTDEFTPRPKLIFCWSLFGVKPSSV